MDNLKYYNDSFAYNYDIFAPKAPKKAEILEYPDKKVIERCAMMHDSGARTEQMLEMWARVKGEVVKPWVLIVIGITLLTMLVLGIRRKVLQYRRSMHRLHRRRKR